MLGNLADVIQRVEQASEVTAVYAVVVDVLNPTEVECYRRFGCSAFPKSSL